MRALIALHGSDKKGSANDQQNKAWPARDDFDALLRSLRLEKHRTDLWLHPPHEIAAAFGQDVLRKNLERGLLASHEKLDQPSFIGGRDRSARTDVRQTGIVMLDSMRGHHRQCVIGGVEQECRGCARQM